MWPTLQLKAPEFDASSTEKLKSWLHQVAELALKHEDALPCLRVIESPKNAAKALEEKEKADEMLANDKASEATTSYTHAILLSPANETLPLLYANRGLAFFKLDSPEQALWDADEALRTGYPADRAYKLHYRRALALSKLRRCPHCTHAAAVQALAGAPAEDKEVRTEMEKLKAKIAHPDDKQCEKKQVESTFCKLKLAGSRCIAQWESFRFAPCATEPCGRYMIAPGGLPRGDVVIQEKPAAFAVADIVRTRLCPNCLARTTTPFPCTTCLEFYCSAACRQADAAMHKPVCSTSLLRAPGLVRLAVRLLALATVEELAALAPHALEARTTAAAPGTAFGKLFALQVHFDALGAAATHAATDTALTAKIMSASAPFTAVPFETLHAHLFRICAQLRANTVAIRQLVSSENGQDSREINLAHAIYTNSSMLNHSCDPNALLLFDGTTLTVRLTESVPADAEVNISYGPHRGRMVMQARKERLREQYAFDCNCRACADELTKAPLAGFRCQAGKQCKAPLPESGKCGECGKEHSMEDLKRLFTLIPSMFEKLSEMEKKEVPIDKRVAVATSARDTALRLRMPTDRVVAEVCDCLARQLALAGRNMDAAEQVYAAIRVLKLWFPADSPEVAMELAKVASLMFRSGDPVSAMASVREAIAAVAVHEHLPTFATDLKELKRMERMLLKSRK